MEKSFDFLGPEYTSSITRFWRECYDMPQLKLDYYQSDDWNNGMKEMEAIFKKEADPNGRDLKAGGAKADAGKAPILKGLLQYFPRALTEVARTSDIGAHKYSWKGWESVPDGIARYGDALGRHLIAEEIEGKFDGDTGLLHSTQVAWNALARLELILREQEKHV